MSQLTNNIHASAGSTAATAAPMLRVVLHADIYPHATMATVAASLTQAARELGGNGIHLREIGVERDGLGDALIDQLRANAALGVPVSPIPAR